MYISFCNMGIHVSSMVTKGRKGFAFNPVINNVQQLKKYKAACRMDTF